MHGIINAPYNGESAGHWYGPDGKVVALVPYATPVKDKVTGELKTLRPPTLADARKIGLLRSWSLVKKILHSRSLEDYWTTQCVQTFRKMVELMDKDEILGMDFEVLRDLVVQQASEHREQAADAGSEYHAALAHYAKTHELPINPCHVRACQEIEAWEKSCGLHWPEVEVGFANLDMGYGGTIDRLYKDQHTIADIKTIPADSKKRSWPYPDWPEQLAYYWMGVTNLSGQPHRLINLVIARETGALVEAIVWGEGKYNLSPDQAWRRAFAIDEIWQMRNKWGKYA